MPHFIVEHSTNIPEQKITELAKVIARASSDTGAFPLAGLRVRMHPTSTYVIADGHPDNAFVAIIARVGAGRDAETLKAVSQAISDAVCDHFSDELAGEHFMMSFDIEINDPAFTAKKNAIRKRLG